MSNLFHRQITPSANRAHCQSLPEDPLHAFWLCKEVECVWHPCTWASQSVSSPPENFCDLLNYFLRFDDDFRKEIFVIAAWFLWNRSNALHFRQTAQPLANILSMAGHVLQEFLAAQDPKPPVSRPHPLIQWRPPDQNVYKSNFDAAVFKTGNSAGIGVIARDWRGEAIGALSLSIPLAQTVAEIGRAHV